MLCAPRWFEELNVSVDLVHVSDNDDNGTEHKH